MTRVLELLKRGVAGKARMAQQPAIGVHGGLTATLGQDSAFRALLDVLELDPQRDQEPDVDVC